MELHLVSQVSAASFFDASPQVMENVQLFYRRCYRLARQVDALPSTRKTIVSYQTLPATEGISVVLDAALCSLFAKPNACVPPNGISLSLTSFASCFLVAARCESV